MMGGKEISAEGLHFCEVQIDESMSIFVQLAYLSVGVYDVSIADELEL